MIVNVAPLLREPVGAREDFHVAESPIDPHGDNSGLLEAGAVSIDADIVATHTNPGAYLEGTADASLEALCSRCLIPIETPVHADFAEQYYARFGVMSGESLGEPPADAKAISSDFKIDLTPLLREELMLATPIAALCRPDCKGLCPVCGDDLNLRPHEHETAVDQRLAKLEQLRNFHAERD
ncbi:MAG: DUF177 domain-containing protein [Chloroflexota bacterium]|nr:DUF177 domain-containing protein [Chloroflexota bacterium]